MEEETRQIELHARKASVEKKIAECHLETEGGDNDVNSEIISFEESVSMLPNTSHWVNVELACNGEVNA